MSKKLVAYFSASGVTAKAAKALASAADADLYEITPQVPYTAADLNWSNPHSRSTVEMKNRSSRPAMASSAPDLSDYDTVFLGFPIWWGREPSIVDTFLESADFSGKTMTIFATSGGSGLGKTEAGLKPLCAATVTWKPGRLLNGRQTNASLSAWLGSLSL